MNQELQQTEWEVGYTPAKLALAAVARPFQHHPSAGQGSRTRR